MTIKIALNCQAWQVDTEQQGVITAAIGHLYSAYPSILGGGTVSAIELSKFKAIAESWWDPDGSFKLLHKFNPIRVRYIRDQLATYFSRDITLPKPFTGLSLLDIGCGGGLLAEPMARLGFTVTGIDALDKNILIAHTHATGMGLTITYCHMTVEQLAVKAARFDVILNMEVVEHVADQPLFLSTAATLVAPSGIIITATLNRTLKSLFLAKICAEYILSWLPAGTHEWKRFMRPSELATNLRQCGLAVTNITGITYTPLIDKWRLSNNIDVNYFMVAVRKKSQ